MGQATNLTMTRVSLTPDQDTVKSHFHLNDSPIPQEIKVESPAEDAKPPKPSKRRRSSIPDLVGVRK